MIADNTAQIRAFFHSSILFLEARYVIIGLPTGSHMSRSAISLHFPMGKSTHFFLFSALPVLLRCRPALYALLCTVLIFLSIYQLVLISILLMSLHHCLLFPSYIGRIFSYCLVGSNLKSGLFPKLTISKTLFGPVRFPL